VQPFGNLVHVRGDERAIGTAEALDALLEKHGLGHPPIERALPTLEDVFLEVVRRPAREVAS
jgi:hypothetical protein